MLLMFKVRNYASFKEESILDLRAAPYARHATHSVGASDGISLLKTTAIYGANASGKSNFISAMLFFEQYIFSQFISKKESLDFGESVQAAASLQPFLLSEDKSDASEFEIIFISNGRPIQYGFECTSTGVLGEWYYIGDEKAFERKGPEVTYGPRYRGLLGAYRKIPAGRLYISVLEYFLDDAARKDVLGDFLEFFTKKYNVFMGALPEPAATGPVDSSGLHRMLVDDGAFRSKVAKYMQLVDVGIKGIDIHEEAVSNIKTGKSEKRKSVKTVHDVYGDAGKAVGEEHFDLRQESTGTLRFLAYIQYIVLLMERGGVLIVDELSASMHPKMTKLIVDIFQSGTNENAQLIFTTHDISLLDSNQFRRDEIAFIDKNERGESRLYALSDLKVREDAAFGKDYMQGKYGAIPMFRYSELQGGGT